MHVRFGQNLGAEAKVEAATDPRLAFQQHGEARRDHLLAQGGKQGQRGLVRRVQLKRALVHRAFHCPGRHLPSERGQRQGITARHLAAGFLGQDGGGQIQRQGMRNRGQRGPGQEEYDWVFCTLPGTLSAITSFGSDTVPQLASQGERRARAPQCSARSPPATAAVAPCIGRPVRCRLQQMAPRPCRRCRRAHLQRMQHRVGSVAGDKGNPGRPVALPGQKGGFRPGHPVHHRQPGRTDAALLPDRAGDLQRRPMRKGGQGRQVGGQLGDRRGIGDHRVDHAPAPRRQRRIKRVIAGADQEQRVWPSPRPSGARSRSDPVAVTACRRHPLAAARPVTQGNGPIAPGALPVAMSPPSPAQAFRASSEKPGQPHHGRIHPRRISAPDHQIGAMRPVLDEGIGPHRQIRILGRQGAEVAGNLALAPVHAQGLATEAAARRSAWAARWPPSPGRSSARRPSHAHCPA